MAAYTIFFVLIALSFFGLVYLCMNYALNEMLIIMNAFIADGSVSSQFLIFWNLIFGLWKFLPAMFLFALVLWAAVRAIERKQDGGV